MAELLASGTTAAQSGTFTLAAGESATLFLKAAVNNSIGADVRVGVEVQDAGGVWQPIGQLNVSVPAQVLTAVGTFRVNRQVCAAAIGVDKN
jgi:hypothetical protein